MNMILDRIRKEQYVLGQHPIFAQPTIQNIEELRTFMESHVYAVWDFMSLLKTLQNTLAPTTVPWVPTTYNRSKSARLINEIVLVEETDEFINGGSTSHFDLYCQAMMEIGADTGPIMEFIEMVKSKGVPTALELACVPPESAAFVRSTFDVIDSGKLHCVAGVFCFSRETLISDMFRTLLAQLKIGQANAPRFYHYLDRHIEIDGDAHGPASLDLIELLCENQPMRAVEAEQAAVAAIHARIQLWDQIYKRIKSK